MGFPLGSQWRRVPVPGWRQASDQVSVARRLSPVARRPSPVAGEGAGLGVGPGDGRWRRRPGGRRGGRPGDRPVGGV